MLLARICLAHAIQIPVRPYRIDRLITVAQAHSTRPRKSTRGRPCGFAERRGYPCFAPRTLHLQSRPNGLPWLLIQRRDAMPLALQATSLRQCSYPGPDCQTGWSRTNRAQTYPALCRVRSSAHAGLAPPIFWVPIPAASGFVLPCESGRHRSPSPHARSLLTAVVKRPPASTWHRPPCGLKHHRQSLSPSHPGYG